MERSPCEQSAVVNIGGGDEVFFADSVSTISSNGGVFGSLYGTPILNTPQAAVLGRSACNRPLRDLLH